MMRLPYIIGEYGGQLNFDIYRYVQNIYVVYIYIYVHMALLLVHNFVNLVVNIVEV